MLFTSLLVLARSEVGLGRTLGFVSMLTANEVDRKKPQTSPDSVPQSFGLGILRIVLEGQEKPVLEYSRILMGTQIGSLID